MTPPGCNPATSVAVREHIPYMVGAEARCGVLGSVLMQGRGVQMCARFPRPGLGLWWQQASLSPLHSSTGGSSKLELGGCPALPIGQEMTAGLSPWG